MNSLTQILSQIRSILGLANSARNTAEGIKREADRIKKRKEDKVIVQPESKA